MCFSLYAGTTKPLPRKAWDKESRGLSVDPLGERDAHVISHFSLPEVQRVGSSAGCGCDFPHVTLTQGEWVGYPEVVVDNPAWEATERLNRESLVALLNSAGEKTIELYGIWEDGESGKSVNVREGISLKRILDPDFRFKERGFYTVNL
jgi:alpha-D-ribose 1-methylphosphonate 5-triphosphate synthase subunit PhnL